MTWLWQNAGLISLVWCGLILIFILFWSRLCKLNEMPDIDDVEFIEDGFGSAWSPHCPECRNRTMYIIRPGKVQCSHCDQLTDDIMDNRQQITGG